MAAVIAAQLTEVGICTRVQSYEWGTFFEDIRSGNFEMTTLQWPSVLDPDILRWVFHSENIPDAERRGGGNRGRFRNAEVDRLLDEARTTSERDERRRRYYRVQEILAEELPYVSLWHEDNIVVRRSHVRGFTPTPNARFPGLGAVEIEGDRERPQEEP